MKSAFASWAVALLVVACGNGAASAGDGSDVAANEGMQAEWSLRSLRLVEPVPGSLSASFAVSTGIQHGDETEPPHAADDAELHEFLRSTLTTSDALRAAEHDYKAAREATGEALFSVFPTLSIEIDTGKTKTDELLGGTQNDDYTTASLNLNWNVFASGTGLARIKAANFAAEAARYRAIGAERQIMLEALGIYLEYLAAAKQVQAFKRSKTGLQTVLNATRKRFAAGFASRTDVAQIENELAEIEILLERAERTVEVQAARWEVASGNTPGNVMRWPSTDDIVPDTAQAAVALALENNPTLAGAQNRAQSDHYQAKAAMAGFLPRIDLYGEINRGMQDGVFADEESEVQMGARLTVPVLNLAATSRYRQSRQLAIAARYRTQDTERLIRTEVTTAWITHESLKRELALIDKRIAAGKRIRDGLIKEFEAGLRPVSDFLRQEVELARLEQDRVTTRIAHISTAWQIALQFDTLQLDQLIR